MKEVDRGDSLCSLAVMNTEVTVFENAPDEPCLMANPKGSMSDGQLQLSKSSFTIMEMLNGCCSHIRVAGIYNLLIEGDKDLQIYADERRIDQVVVHPSA